MGQSVIGKRIAHQYDVRLGHHAELVRSMCCILGTGSWVLGTRSWVLSCFGMMYLHY